MQSFGTLDTNPQAEADRNTVGETLGKTSLVKAWLGPIALARFKLRTSLPDTHRKWATAKFFVE